MELSELKTEMDEQFEHVREQFKGVREQFKSVREQFKEEIAAEGEKTRRHFDVVFEQMKAERNLALDAVKATDERLVGVSAANASEHAGFEVRLQDHEKRLTKLEGQ
jgi:hypothetical protein